MKDFVTVDNKRYQVCCSYEADKYLQVFDMSRAEYGFAILDEVSGEYYLSDVVSPYYDEMRGYIESTVGFVELDKVSQSSIFEETIDLMYQTYLAKNNDYGNSVEDTYSRYGDVSFLTRMRDKLNRLDSLCVEKRESKVADEKIEDTILDLANYAVLFYVTRKSKKNN